MDVLLTLGNWLLPLLYLALLVDYGATFFLRTRTQGRSPWLAAAVAVHAALLVLRALDLGRLPVADSQEILSVLALTTAVVYWLAELASRDRRTGAFVLLLVFLFQYTSSIFLAAGGPHAPAPGTESVWGRLHVIPALVAYTAVGFAGVYGLLYLLAQRELRGPRFGMLFDRLPPLESLGRMTWHVLLVGFIFMTLTIAASPLMFSQEEPGAAEHALTAKVVTKIVAGSVAWLLYAAAVVGRLLGKWPAARVSALAVVGFLVVMALLAASGLLH